MLEQPSVESGRLGLTSAREPKVISLFFQDGSRTLAGKRCVEGKEGQKAKVN